MTSRLDQLEARLAGLIEGTFARLFAGALHPRGVALRLAQAMDAAADVRADGTRFAPLGYIVALHPDTLSELQMSHPDVEARLADEIVAFARQLDLLLADLPRIRFETALDLAAGEVRVTTFTPEDEISTTRQLTRTALDAALVDSTRRQRTPAYLILDGQVHVPLQPPLVSIGRQRDNTLVINHGRVSRYHAQLRLKHQRWVVYDLGSTGGTSVNGEPIEEMVLYPGDVIALSGEVRLIYGEDETGIDPPTLPPDDTGHTRPAPRTSTEE